MDDSGWGWIIGIVLFLAFLDKILAFFVTVLGYIGQTFLIAVEYPAHGLAVLGVTNPIAAWLLLGILFGGAVGAVVGFDKIGMKKGRTLTLAGSGAVLFLLLALSSSTPSQMGQRAGGRRLLETGTVATCSSVAGCRNYKPKTNSRAGERVCVYAEALNVNRGGRIDVKFNVLVVGPGGNELTKGPGDGDYAVNTTNASCAHWDRLPIPQGAKPGIYVARVEMLNKLDGGVGRSSTQFKVVAPAASTNPEPSSPPGSIPDDIAQFLQTWGDSFRAGNFDTQMDCYAPLVESYFRKRNLSRAEVRREREGMIAQYGPVRQFEVSNVELISSAPGRAEVKFKTRWELSARDVG